MTIRMIKDTDIPKLIPLYEESHLLHAENRPDIFHEEISFNEDFIKSNLSDINLVAIEEEKIVGFLIASVKEIKDNTILKDNRKMFIEIMSVKKEFQHRKIGQMLMSELEKIALEKQIQKIELCVWAFNHNAQEFYKHLGYTTKNMRLEKSIEK